MSYRKNMVGSTSFGKNRDYEYIFNLRSETSEFFVFVDFFVSNVARYYVIYEKIRKC